MPYETKWYRKDDILMLVYSGILTIEDMVNANKKAFKLTADTPNNFFVLVDITNIEKADFTFPEMVNNPIIKAAASSPQVYWVVYFGGEGKPLYKFLVSILAQSANHRLMVKITIEDALEFIDSMRI